MAKRQGSWKWFSLVVLLLVAPLLLFPGGWKTLGLAVLPLLWLGNRIFTGHFVPQTPYDVVLLSLLVMVLVSLYATYDLTLSLPKISGVLLGISVFYAVTNVITSPRALHWMWGFILITIAVFGGLAVVGANWGNKIALLQRIGAALPVLVRGLPGADNGFHPAEIGGTLTWLLFLPIAGFGGWWSQRRSPKGVIWLIGLAGLTLGLWLMLLLTQSRSAWLGAIAGSVVILWLIGRWGRRLLVVGLLAGLLVTVIFGPDRLWPLNGSSGAVPAQSAIFNLTLTDRAEIWSRALYGLQDFPLTGMGLGMFRYVMPVLYPLFTVNPEANLGHAHNEWLQAGVDAGLPGLIAFVALQGLAVWLAYQAFRREAGGLLRWMMAGVLAGLIAHSVFGLTDAVALGAKPGVFYWVLLALTAAVWRLNVIQTPSDNQVPA